jgi:Protein of unknown function (DUF2637)
MSNYSAVRGPRLADPRPLRVAALTAVVAGVVLLAAAAFVLSYAGIHQIALRGGISPRLARLYPVTFDAMLVVAAAAALALRGAGWWPRAYAWFSLLLMLAAVAAGDALRAAHVVLPIQPTRVVVAVTPWVLLLLAFGLLLEMLRHFRRVRPGNGHDREAGRVAVEVAAARAVNGNGDPGTAGPRAAVTWASAGVGGDGQDLPRPRSGLDMLLGPREGEPPAMPGTRPDGAMTDEYPGPGYYPDPVAYGEETGYVHPDSYRDHGDFPGVAYPGDHEAYAGPGDPDQPEHANEPEPGPSGDAAAGQAEKHLAEPHQAEPHQADPRQAEPHQAEQHQADEPQPTANSGEANPPAPKAAPANAAAANAAAASQATVNPVEAQPGEAQPGEAKPGEAQPAAAHPAQAGSANASSPAAGPAAAGPAGSPAEQSPSGSTAQTGPAATHDSPAHNGDAPAQPATPPANPRLERLRSTPAPPDD